MHWSTLLQVIVGSGLGAGVVTFGLNFWKAERDTRRAQLEELYTALQKYTHELALIGLEVRMKTFDATQDRGEFKAQFDRISVLINLYFPRLKADFEDLRDRNEEFLVNPQRDYKRFEQECLGIVEGGERLKQAVVDLAREQVMLP